jgi:hypothetical protein
MSNYFKNESFRIVFYYAFFAGLWIILSDSLLETLADSVKYFSFLQTIKGWVFVSITSFMLYFLIKRLFDLGNKDYSGLLGGRFILCKTLS